MHEGPPNPEKHAPNLRERCIESLRANAEDLTPLHTYLDAREAEVRTSKDGLELNAEVARIYRDAGMLDAARAAYADAAEQARQEGEDSLYLALVKELDTLR